MTPEQAAALLQVQQYTNDHLAVLQAQNTQVLAHLAASFWGLCVLVGFVIVFGIIAAVQNRPRLGL